MDVRQLESLREDYRHEPLHAENLRPDPFDQFAHWFDQVLTAELKEPNAMVLASCGPDEQPSSRVVLLKGVREDGFTFYTNYRSRKARDIEYNDRVSLLFYWSPLARQVRIEGTVRKLDKGRSERYFKSRPKGSQISAMASPQSHQIDSREELENYFEEIAEQYQEVDELPLPEFWGGYLVQPHRFEFWQGRENRLHDRFRYRLDEENRWKIHRLAP